MAGGNNIPNSVTNTPVNNQKNVQKTPVVNSTSQTQNVATTGNVQTDSYGNTIPNPNDENAAANLNKNTPVEVNSNSTQATSQSGPHKVVKGDTLWTILARRGFSQAEIPAAIKQVKELNGLADANKITVGQELKMPERPQTDKNTPQNADNKPVTVKKGDTLGKLLAARGFKPAEMPQAIKQAVAMNKLKSADLIKEGAQLTLPQPKSQTQPTDKTTQTTKTPDTFSANKTNDAANPNQNNPQSRQDFRDAVLSKYREAKTPAEREFYGKMLTGEANLSDYQQRFAASARPQPKQPLDAKAAAAAFDKALEGLAEGKKDGLNEDQLFLLSMAPSPPNTPPRNSGMDDYSAEMREQYRTVIMDQLAKSKDPAEQNFLAGMLMGDSKAEDYQQMRSKSSNDDFKQFIAYFDPADGYTPPLNQVEMSEESKRRTQILQ